MSNKEKNTHFPTSGLVDVNSINFYKEGWGNALLIPEGTSGSLVGKLLTIIESWGLPQSQERAIKDVIRNEIYDMFDNAWIIGENDHVTLRKKAFDFGQLSCGGHMPPNFPSYVISGGVGGNVNPMPPTAFPPSSDTDIGKCSTAGKIN